MEDFSATSLIMRKTDQSIIKQLLVPTLTPLPLSMIQNSYSLALLLVSVKPRLCNQLDQMNLRTYFKMSYDKTWDVPYVTI